MIPEMYLICLPVQICGAVSLPLRHMDRFFPGGRLSIAGGYAIIDGRSAKTLEAKAHGTDRNALPASQVKTMKPDDGRAGNSGNPDLFREMHSVCHTGSRES